MSSPAIAPSRCQPAPLSAELRVAVMRTSRRLRRERAGADITEGQYSVLAVLDRDGPATLRTLADGEGVQPPSMTRTVTVLEDAGFVVREPHPVDGRQVLVRPTPAGVGLVREARRRRDAWLASALAELDDADREVLARAAAILTRVAAR